MAQGSLPITTSVLIELLNDIIDLDTLRARLLLPEHYRIDGLREAAFTSFWEGYIDILVSSPDVPEGAEILPKYERIGEGARLLKIDIAPQTHAEPGRQQ